MASNDPEELAEKVWHGCYDRQWRGVIVPEAYAHPARFSRNLIERIFAHGLKQGWWRKGDLIGDPFAGVGCGGVAAAYAGLRWVGVELESRFVELTSANFDYHSERWEAPAFFSPAILHGDSRKFSEILGAAAGIVTSPPYAEGIGHRMKNGGDASLAHPERVAMQKRYTDSMASEGNIADLPTGKAVDGIVTSPPYEDTPVSPQGADGSSQDWNRAYRDYRKSGNHSPFQREMTKKSEGAGYGMSKGQIGRDAGETYWQAMGLVYSECHKVLRPSGILVVVVKDYVKNKARVPLCDQTISLLGHVGFEPVERIRAMLVKERVETTLFGEVKSRVERKSFFRRLAEKKGAPRIDWEEVLVLRKT